MLDNHVSDEQLMSITQSAKDMGPTRAPYGILDGSYMGTPYGTGMGGICNTVPYGTHMGKPIWVTNGNHMGPILDLAQGANVQPTFLD